MSGAHANAAQPGGPTIGLTPVGDSQASDAPRLVGLLIDARALSLDAPDVARLAIRAAVRVALCWRSWYSALEREQPLTCAERAAAAMRGPWGRCRTGMPAPRIVAIGDNCVDVYPTLGQVFPGGGAVNFAVHAARLGADAGYVGVVGDDHHGSLLRDALTAEGVDTSFVRVVPGPTAVTYVRLDDGERTFDGADPGVRDHLRVEPEIEQYLLAADHVHTTLDSGVDHAVSGWSAAGRRISFDFSHRASHRQLALLPFVDIAFFSGQTISPGDAEAAVRAFHARGARLVVLTLNKHGSLAFDGTAVWRQPSELVQPVDTLGAGDGFMAGFVGSFLQDGDVPAALAAGAQASATVCQHYGAFGRGAARPALSANDSEVGAGERSARPGRP